MVINMALYNQYNNNNYLYFQNNTGENKKNVKQSFRAINNKIIRLWTAIRIENEHNSAVRFFEKLYLKTYELHSF